MKTNPLLIAGALTALAGGAVVRTQRQWAAAPDPTRGGASRPLAGTERTVLSSDGAEISLTDAGDPTAPAVVLAHGWTEDRRVWGVVGRALVDAGLRVVAYDQRGHGRSGVGRDGYTIEAIAADLAAVLEQLDLTDATLAGHSMGGMAAQAFCIEFPEVAARRARGLVLVATACGDLGVGTSREKYVAGVLGHPLLERAARTRSLGRMFVRGTFGKVASLPLLSATAEMFASTPADTRTGFFRAMGTMDLSEGLPQVTLPATIVVGSADRLTPLAGARRMAELIPGARLEVLPDLGHMLTYEAPDTVTRLILEMAGHTTTAATADLASAR